MRRPSSSSATRRKKLVHGDTAHLRIRHGTPIFPRKKTLHYLVSNSRLESLWQFYMRLRVAESACPCCSPLQAADHFGVRLPGLLPCSSGFSAANWPVCTITKEHLLRAKRNERRTLYAINQLSPIKGRHRSVGYTAASWMRTKKVPRVRSRVDPPRPIVSRLSPSSR
jgi:hypothetical protein